MNSPPTSSTPVPVRKASRAISAVSEELVSAARGCCFPSSSRRYAGIITRSRAEGHQINGGDIEHVLPIRQEQRMESRLLRRMRSLGAKRVYVSTQRSVEGRLRKQPVKRRPPMEGHREGGFGNPGKPGPSQERRTGRLDALRDLLALPTTLKALTDELPQPNRAPSYPPRPRRLCSVKHSFFLFSSL
jgi:hypothetical protein